MRLAWPLAVALATTVACSEGEAPPPPAASALPPVDARALAVETCARACRRATTCGLEAAKKIASEGSDVEQAELAAASRDAEQAETRCADACARDAGERAEASRELASCLDQTQCELFVKCLDRAAPPG